MIEVKQINLTKDPVERIIVNNSLKSVANSKTRTGEVLGVNNSFFVIPNEKKWIITELTGDSTVDVMGCKISLFYAPNGNDTNLVLIDSVFCNANNQSKNIYYESPIGDGTRALLMRRERIAKALINGGFVYLEK